MSNTKLLVTGSLYEITTDELRELFEKYGKVKNVHQFLNRNAEIEYEDSRDAKDALALDKYELGGEIIRVKIAPTDINPSSLLKNTGTILKRTTERDAIVIVTRSFHDTTIDEFKELFELYGPIKSVKLYDNEQTAEIEYEVPRDSQDALSLDGEKLNNQTISVSRRPIEIIIKMITMENGLKVKKSVSIDPKSKLGQSIRIRL